MTETQRLLDACSRHRIVAAEIATSTHARLTHCMIVTDIEGFKHEVCHFYADERDCLISCEDAVGMTLRQVIDEHHRRHVALIQRGG